MNTSGQGVVTFSKNNNGYFKFNNGLIVQWGRVSTNVITFNTPFSSASSYGISGNRTGTASSNDYYDYFNTPTNSNIQVVKRDGNYPMFWVAIGY